MIRIVRDLNAADLKFLAVAAGNLMEHARSISGEHHFNTPMMEKDLEEMFAEVIPLPEFAIFIAVHELREAGFIMGRTVRRYNFPLHPGHTGFIEMCWVLPEFRQHGIGEAMLAALEHWFAAQGVDVIENNCLIGNYSALNFWKEHGYRAYCINHRKTLKKLS